MALTARFDDELITVIIPTCNRPELLKRAIESVLKQDYANLEVIIIDDDPVNNAKEAIKSFLLHSRIKYICSEVGRGGSAARNTGIRQARGEYIAFLDDDDEWLPEKLTLQLNAFISGSGNLGLVNCGVLRWKEDASIEKYMPKYKGNIYSQELYQDRVFATSTWLVLRSCFFDERVGMFDENLLGRQDYDMALRISKFYEIDFVPKHLTILHEDSGNRISNNFEKRTLGHLQLLEKIRLYTETLPTIKRRRIMSAHYYQISRYLQIYEHYDKGIEFLLKSLREWPFNIKAFIIFIFMLFGDSKLDLFNQINKFVHK